MATYKGIQGYTVQNLAADPTASEAVGQFWYNSGAGKFKVATQAAGSWAASGDFNRTSNWCTGSFGIQTAAIVAGGYPVPNTECEEYDGSTWAEIADVTTGRYGNGGAGVITAGLTFAGYNAAGSYDDATEAWNGTAWTEVEDLNQARNYVSSTNYAPATACLCLGGANPPTGKQDWAEEYNGTSWTALTVLTTGRRTAAGAGTTTSALFIGGNTGGGSPPSASWVASCESWNGTSWAEEADLASTRIQMGSSGVSNTSAFVYGGNGWPLTGTVICEKWNGTSWTEVGDLGTARYFTSSVGTSGKALAGGGSPGVATEEWDDPVYSVKTATVS